MVEHYYNNRNECAVLVSPGYGAGWSTWHDRNLAVDKRVIEKFMEQPSIEEMEEYLASIGYENVYMGGYSNLTIEWVPEGYMFRIEEYDGAESLVVISTDTCYTA